MRKIKIFGLLGVLFIVAIIGAAGVTVRASGGNDYFSFIPFSTSDNCLNWPNSTPAGALPGQPPPVWCLITATGSGTEQVSQNTWFDDFNHGLSFANFENTQYLTYDEIGAWRTKFWRHADHWMLDMAPHPQGGTSGWDRGYALLRPNQEFHFINNKLVVETTVAAGMDAYSLDAWPEIIVTNGPQPTNGPIELYGYDLFPQYWTLGCRLQSTRVPICALKSNDGGPDTPSNRIWEMSFWQEVGTYSYGGLPSGGLENYWHECAVTDPDILCRDHFRLELTRTSLKLFVNDELYFEQSGIPPLPNQLLNGNVYVYLASSQVNHSAETIRYHWDLLSINNPVSAIDPALTFNNPIENICLPPSNKTYKGGLSLSRLLLPLK